MVSCFLIFASDFAMSNAHVYCIFSTCGCGTASSVEFYFFCLHNGGSICYLSSCILSIQGACSCSWLGRFLWQQQTNKPGFALAHFSFVCIHFLSYSPWGKVTDALGCYGGLRSCFARIIPFPPLFFPCSWLIKNCRYFFFTNGVLNLVLGYRIFVCTIFPSFLAHSGFVFCTLWRTFFCIISFVF